MTDPWRGAPTSELADQVLPRWFVVLAVVLVPLAIVAAVLAFVAFDPEEVPVAARRPPPSGGFTTGVGAVVVGDSPARPADGLCAALDGVAVGGTTEDRAQLARGLEALCSVGLPGDVAARLERFARAGGVVRFAQFELTGVDSTADLQAEPPLLLVNAKFARTSPAFIAPLLAHDATFLEADPATAEGALEARQAEAAICEELFAAERPPRGCDDAAALLGLEDPLAALRAAGFAEDVPG